MAGLLTGSGRSAARVNSNPHGTDSSRSTSGGPRVPDAALRTRAAPRHVTDTQRGCAAGEPECTSS